MVVSCGFSGVSLNRGFSQITWITRIMEGITTRRSSLQWTNLILQFSFSLPEVKNGFIMFGNLTVILRLNEIGDTLKQKTFILIR